MDSAAAGRGLRRVLWLLVMVACSAGHVSARACALDEAYTARYGGLREIRVLFLAADGIFDQAALTAVAALEEALSEVPDVRSVTSPLSVPIVESMEAGILVRSASPNGVVPRTDAELSEFRSALQFRPSLFTEIVSKDGTAGMVLLHVAPDAELEEILARIAEIVTAFRSTALDLAIYVEEQLTAESFEQSCPNLLDWKFHGSLRVIVEVDSDRRDGLKSPSLLKDIATLEAALKPVWLQETVSIAGLVQQLNNSLSPDNDDPLGIPPDETRVRELLILYGFQGGVYGAISLGDFSAGLMIGMTSANAFDEAVCIGLAVDRYLIHFFANSGTAIGHVAMTIWREWSPQAE